MHNNEKVVYDKEKGYKLLKVIGIFLLFHLVINYITHDWRRDSTITSYIEFKQDLESELGKRIKDSEALSMYKSYQDDEDIGYISPRVN